MSVAVGTLWKKFVEAWPVLVTVCAIAIGLYVNQRLLEYRVSRIETDLIEVKADIKESLKTLNASVNELKVGVAELVAIQKQTARNGR
jgi:hypothetical protein